MNSYLHSGRNATEMTDGQTALAEGETPEHQLGNLAQALNGYLELLAMRTKDEASVRYIESARIAALAMVRTPVIKGAIPRAVAPD